MTKQWSSHLGKEVAKFIELDLPRLWDQPPPDVLNLQNGLLDLKSHILYPHSPRHLTAVQLPVVYDPHATCPFWDQFVSQVFPADAYKAGVPWELAAWLMTPDTNVQKAVLLLGPGANGKSRYLAALRAFLGDSNTAAMSIHVLERHRFALPGLLGKLANICPDLPSGDLENTSIFKQLTGGDRVLGEYKYGKIFEFVPFARLIFSANQPPRSHDSSTAFFRRWLVVPFDRSFEGKDALPQELLDARLSHSIELSGLLNRALAVLPRVREEGLTETPAMFRAREECERLTDPLRHWLETELLSDPACFLLNDDLLAAYNEACRLSGRPVMTQVGFGKALAKLRPDLVVKQRKINGKPQRGLLGIRLKDRSG